MSNSKDATNVMHIGESFECPFCDTGFVTAGKDQTGKGHVLHSVPYCETFDVNDGDTFLKQAREKRLKPQL